MNLSFLDNLIMKFPIDGNFDLINATKNLNIKNNNVLDIGFGEGGASLFFALGGLNVTALGWDISSYNYPKELFKKLSIDTKEILFEDYNVDKKFGLIWASHVLEHTQNPGFFLEHCWDLLDDDGYLCIIVPPYKSQVVGGHITTGWNTGQLMYNLLLKNFDIKNGHFIKHGYNLCAFVKKSKKLNLNLRMDNGDIESTKDLWPIEAVQGFEGSIDRVNWFVDFKSFDSYEKRIKELESKNKEYIENNEKNLERIKELESKNKEYIENNEKNLERIKELESKNKEYVENNEKNLERIKELESKNKEYIENNEKNNLIRIKELEELLIIKNTAINDLLKKVISND